MTATPEWLAGQVSRCHLAPVTLSGIEDFIGSGRVSTVYPVCSECGEACDIEPDERLTDEEYDEIDGHA